MKKNEHQNEVLKMLAKLEDVVGGLYEAYAEKFPDSEDFWQSLAADEARHASWIRQLEPLVRSGAVYFDEDRFRTKRSRDFIDYVNEQSTTVQEQEMPLIRAVSVALDIENAFLEKVFFEAVEGDSPELERLVDRLATASREHRDKLQKVWDKHRELHR